MLSHSIIITPTETVQLWKLYESLTRQLENNKGLVEKDLHEMGHLMFTVLKNQPGLEVFWLQVQENPFERYYLHLTHADKEILNLPWQLAIDDKKYPFIYISKGWLGNSLSNEFKPQPGPLRVLVMIASPDDLGIHNRLSFEEEEDAILKALAPLWEKGMVQVDFTDYGSLQSVEAYLKQQHYHILYVSGHGNYSNNTGYLLLENQDTMQAEPVTARDFAATVVKHTEHKPTLVVLNSCQTAQGNITDGFPGVSDELLRAGIPAVIAMAFSIIDQFATAFATYLFEGLANRDDLHGAYSESLKAMREEESQFIVRKSRSSYPAQWLIPQLYCDKQVKEIVNWFADEKEAKPSLEKSIDDSQFLFHTPHKNYSFIGRRRECARLYTRLIKKEPVLLRGQGGVGKTSLAEYLIKRLVSHDVHFHCFAFNEINTGIHSMIASLEDYLEQANHGNSIIEADRYTSVTGKLEFLLQEVTALCQPVWIFDNMESCQQNVGGPLKEGFVEWMDFVKEHLLNRYPVIFTGRYPVVEIGTVYDCSLNQVSFADFYRKCRQLSIQHIEGEYLSLKFSDVAHTLFKTLGGNYRVLEVFDEIYRNEKSQVILLLQQLSTATKQPSKENKLLGWLKAKVHENLEDRSRSLIFSELLKLLKEEELVTLQLLVFFLRPILSEGLIKQRPTINFANSLQKLKNLTLIEEQQIAINEGPVTAVYHFYYVTPLVRDWLENCQIPAIDFSHRLAAHHYENDNKQTGENYYEDLNEAFGHYVRDFEIDKINQVGLKLADHYFGQGLFSRALQIAQEIERVSGIRTYEYVYNRMGLIYRIFGKYDLAIKNFEKSITERIRQRCKQNDEEAIEFRGINLGHIGQVYYDQGNYDYALRIWEQSVGMLESVGNFKKQNEILVNVSAAYIGRGKLQQAMELLNECSNSRKALGLERLDERMAYLNSLIAKKLGQYDAAMEYTDQAISMHHTKRQRQGEAAVLNNKGEMYMRIGELDKAMEYFRESWNLAKMIGEEAQVQDTLTNISEIHRKRGNLQEALNFSELCLYKQQKMGDEHGECISLNQLGKLHTLMGNYEKAIKALNRSLLNSKHMRDQWGKGDVLNNIGFLYYRQKNYDYNKALKFLKKSLSLREETGDRLGEAQVLHNLAAVAWEQNNFHDYFSYGKKAYAIFETFNDAEGLYLSGRLLSKYFLLDSRPEYIEQGLSYLRCSYSMACKAGFPISEDMARTIQRYGSNSKEQQVAAEPAKTNEASIYLMRQLEKDMEKAIIKNIENNPLQGTGLEGNIVYLVTGKASEAYKKSWCERKAELGITEEQINAIVDEVAEQLIQKYTDF